jgi:hypothetical protein
MVDLYLKSPRGRRNVEVGKIVDGGLDGRVVKGLSGFQVLAGLTRQIRQSIIRQCYHAAENLTGLASVVAVDGTVGAGSSGEDCGVGKTIER